MNDFTLTMQIKFVGATCMYRPTYRPRVMKFWVLTLVPRCPWTWRDTRLEFLSSRRTRHYQLPTSMMQHQQPASQHNSQLLLLLLLARRIETCWNIDSCPRNITLLWKASVDTCLTLRSINMYCTRSYICHTVKLLINAHKIKSTLSVRVAVM